MASKKKLRKCIRKLKQENQQLRQSLERSNCVYVLPASSAESALPLTHTYPTLTDAIEAMKQAAKHFSLGTDES